MGTTTPGLPPAYRPDARERHAFAAGGRAQAERFEAAAGRARADPPGMPAFLRALAGRTPDCGAALIRGIEIGDLPPTPLLVIDNHVAAHGRSAFRPCSDGRDRWPRRFYSLRQAPDRLHHRVLPALAS
jgi:hypothetical protein